VVGGLSSVVGISGSLLLLAGFALVGLSSLTPLLRRAPQLT
jgi:hypothetical protein